MISELCVVSIHGQGCEYGSQYTLVRKGPYEASLSS